jgi:hypothetical protein
VLRHTPGDWGYLLVDLNPLAETDDIVDDESDSGEEAKRPVFEERT